MGLLGLSDQTQLMAVFLYIPTPGHKDTGGIKISRKLLSSDRLLWRCVE